VVDTDEQQIPFLCAGCAQWGAGDKDEIAGSEERVIVERIRSQGERIDGIGSEEGGCLAFPIRVGGDENCSIGRASKEHAREESLTLAHAEIIEFGSGAVLSGAIIGGGCGKSE
jgi:hypothetical protein